MGEPLNPCPFCGGTLDTICVASQVVAVECLGCGVQMRTRTGGAEIVAAVNRRTVPREQVIAAMAAAWWPTPPSPAEWVNRSMAILLDGVATAKDIVRDNSSHRAVAVAHALGYPGAKVPT